MSKSKFVNIWRYGILDYPKRIRRFSFHIFSLLSLRSQIPDSKWYDWPVDLIFYSTDLLFVPEIQMSFILLLKANMRPLNETEYHLINDFYGKAINLDYVLINSTASKVVRKFAYAYVTHNIVHFDDKIKDAILIHEMMHVYQFQKYGSVYIYRALKAQKSKYGYDYGGIMRLKKGVLKGKTIFQYNFEQQAMIMEDYFISTKHVYSNLKRDEELEVYRYFHKNLFT